MRQSIYLLETGEVLMSGYCDWSTNSFYDSDIHGIATDNGSYAFELSEETVYWDGSGFTSTPPSG